jgi:sigma-B regulation protein RsbU (phosphoserine phosphatase)
LRISIRTQLLAALIPAIIVLFGLVVFISFKDSEKTVLEQINREAYELARSHAREFDVLFESSRKIAESLTLTYSTAPALDRGLVERAIVENLLNNPQIYGSTASFIPESTDLGFYGPYYYRSGDTIAFSDLAAHDYDYCKWDWFIEPVKKLEPVWSDLYLDEGGGDILMVTYSTPIFRESRLIGVATVDIALDNLILRIKKLQEEKRIGETGYAFIISRQGRFIAHPEKEILSDETIFQLTEKTNDPDLKKLAGLITSLAPNFTEMRDPFTGKQAWVITTHIESTDWTFVIVYPRDEILKPLEILRNKIMLFAGLVILLVITIILGLSNRVTMPIRRLVKQADDYARGHFSEKINEDIGPSEIQNLSSALNKLGDSITEQIENVRQTTAQKEGYRQELLIAADIQQSILPQKNPPFPEIIDRLDLFGINRAAREVGGDFFDYFDIPGGRIGFVIADVSDKGAPSSIFMAMTRILIREIAERGLHPAEILRRANYMLAKDNSSAMFVTAIYGDYDPDSGKLRLASAGHNPPLIINSGGIREIKLPVSLPLGALQNIQFEQAEIVLAIGETLFLYTDGITEAFCGEKAYGMDRLAATISKRTWDSAQSLAETILEDIDRFCPPEEQADDITMVVLRNVGSSAECKPKTSCIDNAVHLILPACTDILSTVSLVASETASRLGFEEKEIQHIILALDEVLNNAIMHSYHPESSNKLQVIITPHEKGIRVCVIDYGVPFDFKTSVERYKGNATIDQPIGGIGLFLVKTLADEFYYEPGTFEGNRVSFVKYLTRDK